MGPLTKKFKTRPEWRILIIYVGTLITKFYLGLCSIFQFLGLLTQKPLWRSGLVTITRFYLIVHGWKIAGSWFFLEILLNSYAQYRECFGEVTPFRSFHGLRKEDNAANTNHIERFLCSILPFANFQIQTEFQ